MTEKSEELNFSGIKYRKQLYFVSSFKMHDFYFHDFKDEDGEVRLRYGAWVSSGPGGLCGISATDAVCCEAS